MSLDIDIYEDKETLFEANITHNLTEMAERAGLYHILWHPYSCNIVFARELTPLLERGIENMRAAPDVFRQLDAKSGWGTYEQFLPWLERLLQATKDHPTGRIHTST